jgi:hypothetical protein
MGKDDAAYIAHAHNMMPRILDVLRAGQRVKEYGKEHGLGMTIMGGCVIPIQMDLFEALVDALDALQEKSDE